MSMKKEIRKELRALRASKARVAKDWRNHNRELAKMRRLAEKEYDRACAAIGREYIQSERRVDRALEIFNRRIAILEGRLV